MKKSPVTLTADVFVKDVIVTMTEKNIGCIPIVEDDGKLCGIFTEKDIIHFTAKALSV